ncbi:MAG: hypothetical protein QOJ20_2574 [Mycobacterium sp.]|jgi:hypothetical protein|nr:hypothetical protein [Mycobacterium sp.]MDT5281379.1 hypothetical protein [Mycobacterium sp.]
MQERVTAAFSRSVKVHARPHHDVSQRLTMLLDVDLGFCPL